MENAHGARGSWCQSIFWRNGKLQLMGEQVNNIGLEIKELREYLGLSQRQLAKISGLTPAAICQIESEQRSPSLDTINKICTALDIEPAYLFRNKQEERTPDKLKALLKEKKICEADMKQVEKFIQYLSFARNN
jgi:transcriptional regulator with XRE-family HTH domain